MASSEQTDRPRLDELVTEGRLPQTADYDELTTRELVELVNREDASVPAAVAAARDELAAALDAIVDRLRDGGRLVYAGAGTSGRLAELDASECESTFSSEPGRVVALVAGAGLPSAAHRDAAEDDPQAGADAVRAIDVSDHDAVVGVSASGRTPFVVGALEAAAAEGALTVCIVSTPDSELARIAQHTIAVVVGPEVISGSTRLKAGTAQKLVLNAISTISMVRLGKTYGDLMVDVAGANEKQRARARRAVRLATGADDGEVDEALAAAGGSAKVAIVSLLAGVDTDTARARLGESAGSVRGALQ
ncbi:MAG TPA: N-acetylmuramic acid 6-phosphate etherase [Gaiellaceae bacterium]|nr:N-acetylmuramic acid 6-phosphate etherase [Gaiellaceae bacterium]